MRFSDYLVWCMLVGTFHGLYTGIPTERLQLTRSITCIKHRTRVRARAHTQTLAQKQWLV